MTDPNQRPDDPHAPRESAPTTPVSARVGDHDGRDGDGVHHGGEGAETATPVTTDAAEAKPEHVPAHRQKSLLWWALLLVPAVVAAGLVVGQLSGSGESDPWFASLVKPDIYPPGWLFGAVWTILYALMGFALALVVASDRRAYKGSAVAVFLIQLAVNLAWSPIFFGAHLIGLAFFWILLMLVLIITTMAIFAKVSRLAAALLVPYLAWVSFAAILNLQIWQLN
ncbi:TspO/MBR family protein [Croceicoccus sp. YJ47]|uniref:TspO/MBR family protein n=1 Tax=Croceicoccus sp. YJ47 TaxID=2798724 RepID=UPI0019220834|nr:TspO/MBR family protein [Croceicoccus sp. YJ47]QQN73471.1 tryptophan-rich sensory protein [Croceicoccus sp. YJ47]